MSSSSTRLSLNSLSSLNDESSFERKYSFSSLLEERTSTWDSEGGGSMRWLKLSRVESGTSSLNTSFSYRNRSPIPSSSTSPALSVANIPSLDAHSFVNSVTKSPTLSVTTSSSHLTGTSPPVPFGTGSTRFSGTSLTMSVGGRSDYAGSRIPTLSAGKSAGTQATSAPLTLMSIAKASALSSLAGATLSVNDGLSFSSHQKSLSSDMSVTCQSQRATTGSVLSTSVVATNGLSSTDSFVSAVTTTPTVLLTTGPAVSVTTSPTVSVTTSTPGSATNHLPVSVTTSPAVSLTTSATVSVTAPSMSVINPAVSVTSSPAVSVTSPTVSVTSTPAATPTTSPAVLLTTLSLTTVRTMSETDSPDTSTPKSQVLTQEHGSELTTNSASTDTPSTSSSENPSTDNYPIVIPTTQTQQCFSPLISGNPLHPVSFSRHIVISPSSPPTISPDIEETYDQVFDSLDSSPGKDLNATSPSGNLKRTRDLSEGTWTLIPNGDCKEAFTGIGAVGPRCGLDGSGAPGKEKVRFQGLSKRTGSVAGKERPNDRRLSIPTVSVIDLDMKTTKQPVKKSRSMSYTTGRALPYEAPNYSNSGNRKTATSSERFGKGLSDGNTVTLYEKNGETRCSQNSVISCTENSVYLSANAVTLQESGPSLSGENTLARERRVLWSSGENPNARSFGGLSTHSEKGVIAVLEEYKMHCDDAFTANETVLPKNDSDKPEVNFCQNKLPMDCLSRCDLPNKVSLSVVTNIPADAPLSPPSPTEKKSPHRQLQRPLFPPPPVPSVPAKRHYSLE